MPPFCESVSGNTPPSGVGGFLAALVDPAEYRLLAGAAQSLVMMNSGFISKLL